MSPSTLVELLTLRATTHADRTLSFLVDGETDVVSLSFAELDRRARCVAAALHGQVEAGDRVLLLYPPGLDYVVGLFGALYAGAVAVPAYPPDPSRLARTLPRLVGILEDCGAHVVLTTEVGASVSAALAGLAPALGGMTWVATDALSDGTCDPVCVGAEDPAIIQYTSGSTAEPKGVVLPHRAILANVEMMRARANHTDEDRILSWVPVYHDLGLFGGVVHPLALGATAWLMSPIDFLKRPMRWLEAIHRLRATASSGPNFAFDLCVRKSTPEERAPLDLSCWRTALIGAEPIRPETLDRFAEAFGPSGFDRRAFFAGYGLAEGVLSVTGGYAPSLRRLDRRSLERGWIDEGEDAVLVSCMAPLDGLSLAIVRDGRRARADDVGEIWVSGPSVGAGYLNRPDATAATFEARLPNEPGTWLRTGDLGFVRDGALYVTGRHKDLIIVRGRNVLPQDVERATEAAHHRIRPGCSAAFAVDDGEERLGVAVEVAPGPDDAAVVDAIRTAVVDALEVTPAVIALLPPGALPKTSSGKVQRSATRAAVSAGGWGAIHASEPPSRPIPSPTEDLVGWLRATVAEALRVDEVAADRPFAELGLDSLQQADIAGRLEVALGRPVTPTLLYDHPTIERLVDALRPEAPTAPPRLDGPRSQRPRVPRPEPSERVIVVGGGPAGLTTASRLIEHGYTDIVVLERDEDVGGKVRTALIDGRQAELGMTTFTRHYHQSLAMVADLGLTPVPGRWFLLARSSGELGPLDHRRARSWLARFAAAGGFDLDRPIRPGLCDHPKDWWEPAGYWLGRHGLLPVPEEIDVAWTTSGYGWIGEAPVVYLIKYLHRIQDWFGGGSFSLAEGNQELWRRLARRIEASGRAQVRTGTRVASIERGGDGVIVHTERGDVLRGAAVVMACPPEAALAVLDATPEERDLLGRFQTVPYVSGVVDVPGMRDRGPITWLDNLAPHVIGPTVMFVHQPDVGVGVMFQYTPDDEPGHDALLDDCLRADLASVDAEPGAVRMRVPWRFFPHLPPGSGDVPAQVEALQGTRRTWYTGAWLDFEGMEDIVAYAVDLVDHLFAAAPSAEVAIVGAAGRFAGAPDLEVLWALLEEGRSAFGPPPSGRRDGPAWAALGPHAHHGAFVDDVEGFDHVMFRMSPQEAQAADPQHRLLLELTWSALEDAGIAPDSLQGSRAGVFVGIGASEYLDGCPDDHPLGDSPYLLPGNLSAMAPGRVAYLLGVEGPAVAVDSACSSALVALHQAAASLRAGECDLAIVGGVALSLSPRRMRGAANAGMLSPTGRLASFDADADGFVRGDGAGVVVLQRLGEARDPLAVVRGSAVNQDGARNGLMAPNPRTREAVVRAALDAAAVSPAELDAVEAHGSGTVLGDAMELTALSAVFAGRATPCALTCVKPLVGHTEAASGMAGLLATLQAMRHETLPGLRVDRPNAHAAVDPARLTIDAAPRPWPRGRRTAGVGAYSVSGTNAWVVLADPPPPDDSDAGAPPVLFLSAATGESLRTLATRYRDALAAGAALDVLCRVSAGGRAHLRHRAALVADPETLLHDLARVAAGESVLHGCIGVAGRAPEFWMSTDGVGGPGWVDAVRAEAERWPTLRGLDDVAAAASAVAALLASAGVRGEPSTGTPIELGCADTAWAALAPDGFGLARLFARLYVAGARPPHTALRPGDRAPKTPFHRAPSAWWHTPTSRRNP
ncbi:MAG: AMP-binding protein [Alphaproteobacteria bacterium]|nr:AMP-binding protein [Alphaproteobacteria bacterium]